MLAEIAAGQSAVEAARQYALRPKLLADIYGSSSISRLMEDTEKRRKMFEGPLSEARRIGLLDPDSDFRKALSAATEARESAFRLPAKNEFSTLIKQATAATSVASSLAKELNSTDPIRAAMERMTHPWLQIDHALVSTSTLVELISSGSFLHWSSPPSGRTEMSGLTPCSARLFHSRSAAASGGRSGDGQSGRSTWAAF